MQRSLDIRMAVLERIWKNETEVIDPPHRYNNDVRGINRIISKIAIINGTLEINNDKESTCI